MRVLVLVLVLLIGGAGLARARCADDLEDLRGKVERAQKRQPSPQAAAAGKELQKTDRNIKEMDEVDCYNAVARIRRILNGPPPVDAAAKDK